MKIDPIATYVDQFAAQRAVLPGNGIAWLDDAREAAIARFAEVGFPTNRDERWKFTDLRRFARTSYAPAPSRREQSLASPIFSPQGALSSINNRVSRVSNPLGADCHAGRHSAYRETKVS